VLTAVRRWGDFGASLRVDFSEFSAKIEGEGPSGRESFRF